MTDNILLPLVSDTVIKALKIVQEHEPLRPRIFSEIMWPDNPNHNRVSNIGRSGATRGVGMWFAGGGFLAKLRRRGLVRRRVLVDDLDNRYRYTGYVITELGLAVLKNHERRNKP